MRFPSPDIICAKAHLFKNGSLGPENLQKPKLFQPLSNLTIQHSNLVKEQSWQANNSRLLL